MSRWKPPAGLAQADGHRHHVDEHHARRPCRRCRCTARRPAPPPRRRSPRRAAGFLNTRWSRSRDQRHAAHAPHQDDVVDVRRLELGVEQHVVHHLERPVDQLAADLLELAAGSARTSRSQRLARVDRARASEGAPRSWCAPTGPPWRAPPPRPPATAPPSPRRRPDRAGWHSARAAGRRSGCRSRRRPGRRRLRSPAPRRRCSSS